MSSISLRVFVAEPADDLVVRLDGDPLGHQVFFDHGAEFGLLVVGAVAAGGQALGIEVGFALELGDPQGDLVHMGLLVVGVL